MYWTDEPLQEEFPEGAFAAVGFTYEKCSSCGETLLGADQLDEVEKSAVAAARAHLGRLSPDEVYGLRMDLGLTQADLEEQVGVSSGTVGRWERGESLHDSTADRLMRIIRAHPELLPELGYVAREGRGPYRTRRR